MIRTIEIRNKNDHSLFNLTIDSDAIPASSGRPTAFCDPDQKNINSHQSGYCPFFQALGGEACNCTAVTKVLINGRLMYPFCLMNKRYNDQEVPWSELIG